MEKKAHNGVFAKLRIKNAKKKKHNIPAENQLWPGPRREGTMLKDLPLRFLQAQVKKLTAQKQLKGYILDEIVRRSKLQ
jgi:hypothetical protein